MGVCRASIRKISKTNEQQPPEKIKRPTTLLQGDFIVPCIPIETSTPMETRPNEIKNEEAMEQSDSSQSSDIAQFSWPHVSPPTG
ncbi:hypothetical protein OUZ56_017056 [Daphnia magna]|uniref:Uncharacterized protein n=1 Tax=Daphnia magna TaxID=35525 RepID=A0ABR0AS15_9CRUS|nr:hypothetical protein OUZ56_017056 [Daphnia magna]